MAFYNSFPTTYQNPYYQQPQAQQAMNNNLIWVSGEAGAKAYLVAPNTTVPLWDSEASVIYLKSADASGMPSIKTLDYTIRAENQPMQAFQTINEDYISREEFNSLESKINVLQNEINKIKPHKKEDKHND